MNQGNHQNLGKGNQPQSGWSQVSQPGQLTNASLEPIASQAMNTVPRPVKQSPVPLNPKKDPHNSRFSLRLLLVFLALALLTGMMIWGVSELRDHQVRQSIAPYQNIYAPNIFIDDIPLAGLTPQEAYSQLDSERQRRINSWTLAITYQGFTFSNLNYSVLGFKISDDELYRLLNEAWLLTHKGSIHEQKAAIDTLAVKPYQAYTSQKELQGNQLQVIMDQIAPYVNADPVNAAILEFRPDAENPFVFQNDKAGTRLDTQSAFEQIMAMAAGGHSGTYELKPEIIQPSITRAALEETVKLRTSITTPIASSSPENRNHNIRLSFSKFNGMILKPGQTFSFNDVVGPRTLSAGFAEALEYAYGDLVTGVGGGVCQASTTLYQAAVTAGLSISKRLPHSGKVDYTQMGQDATVYLSKDREIDFQFRNTTAGNIYITAHVKTALNSSKRLVSVINMYGMSLGDGVSYRLRSETVQVLPPPEQKKYVVDNTGLIVTYTDEEKLKSKAVEGQVIDTYLEKYKNGVLLEPPKLLTSDTFNPKPAEYWRGAIKRI